ncbi:unnamed protein product [Triticum turgidum subsp. durum]|uniref:Uncharacterized protein n=1 Tax=Triticum turgidum subsp. durum TaxID=4567 RepID=A0A9R0TX60_TRITD|nr:unnamed protein product [Triticum turgidum subsp. durum]
MPTSAHVAGDGLPSVSASSIVASAVCGYHLVKIVSYSRTKEVPNGKSIHSSPFQLGGRTWHVRYYPNGNKTEDIDYISVFLEFDDTVVPEAGAVEAQAKFSLLDQHGNPVPSYTQRTIRNNYAVNKTWGYDKFIKREELEKSEHLKDDSFTIKVDVAVPGLFHGLETPSIVVPPSDLHRHLGDLLSSKAGADVEFLVGGETFFAHRYVLAARFPVFKAEFFGSMEESTTKNAIRIDDMEAQVFSALLTFMYTDALPDMKQEENMPWLSICLLQRTGMIWRG